MTIQESLQFDIREATKSLIKNINQNQFVDSRGKVTNLKKIQKAAESIKTITFTEDYLKEKLGRQWKHLYIRSIPFALRLYYYFPKESAAQISTHGFEKLENSNSLINSLISHNQISFNTSNINNINKYINDKSYKLSLSNLIYLHNIESSCPTSYSKDIVSDMIEEFESLGIMRCCNKKYWFNDNENQARSYYISKYNLKSYLNLTFKSLSLSDRQEDSILCNKIMNDKEESNIFDNKDNDYINNIIINNDNENRVSKDLIREIDRLSKREFFADKDFTYSLYNKEGELRGRPYANFCSQFPKESKDPSVITRDKKLKTIFKDYVEYDRCASIYNLNLYLQKGVVLPNDRKEYDLYEKFAGRKFVNDERDAWKTLNMTCYFGNNRKFSKFIRSMLDIFFNEKVGDLSNKIYSSIKCNGGRFLACLDFANIPHILSRTEESYKEVYNKLMNWYKETKLRMENEIGQIIGKEIFLYEAYVNLYTSVKLNEMGIRNVTVYDGFYFDKETSDYNKWWEVYQEALQNVKLFYKATNYIKEKQI